MQVYISRRTFVRWFVIIGFGGLLFSQTALAGSEIQIRREPGNMDLFEIQAKIMEVHPESNYLIVAEKKIELVGLKKGDWRLKTIVQDSKGQAIPLSSFKKGQWVFIRGFELSDGLIAAREIYQLPGMVTGKDLGKYPFFKDVPVWEPVPTTP